MVTEVEDSEVMIFLDLGYLGQNVMKSLGIQMLCADSAGHRLRLSEAGSLNRKGWSRREDNSLPTRYHIFNSTFNHVSR